MMRIVRTTLDIEDDVLQAAKDIAANRRESVGKVLSELARKGLQPSRARVRIRNGVPLLGVRTQADRPVTLELVNELRDEP